MRIKLLLLVIADDVMQYLLYLRMTL